tara:strand:+ start:3145 stop:3603 length:459 start_codon:yes stop_codon:yes gene_type:complete
MTIVLIIVVVLVFFVPFASVVSRRIIIIIIIVCKISFFTQSVSSPAMISIENNNKVDRARAVSVPRIVRFRESKCPRRKREWLLLVLFKGTRRRPKSVVHSASGGRESALRRKSTTALKRYLDIYISNSIREKKNKNKKKEHHQEMICVVAS